MYEQIAALFLSQGSSAYFGEPVSQSQHALQCAARAEAEGASDALIVAALLHDIGHLLHGQGEDAAIRGIDTGHESVGKAWLARHFPPAVTEPVRLHVDAKRFLCAVDTTYYQILSVASRQSLELQGGLMSPPEQALFTANPFAQDAVRLRRWDDAAKIQGLDVPPLSHYSTRLSRLIKP
jgi:phosphonate degradation associated HDIG domain protein